MRTRKPESAEATPSRTVKGGITKSWASSSRRDQSEAASAAQNASALESVLFIFQLVPIHSRLLIVSSFTNICGRDGHPPGFDGLMEVRLAVRPVVFRANIGGGAEGSDENRAALQHVFHPLPSTGKMAGQDLGERRAVALF